MADIKPPLLRAIRLEQARGRQRTSLPQSAVMKVGRGGGGSGPWFSKRLDFYSCCLYKKGGKGRMGRDDGRGDERAAFMCAKRRGRRGGKRKRRSNTRRSRKKRKRAGGGGEVQQ